MEPFTKDDHFTSPTEIITRIDHWEYSDPMAGASLHALYAMNTSKFPQAFSYVMAGPSITHKELVFQVWFHACYQHRSRVELTENLESRSSIHVSGKHSYLFALGGSSYGPMALKVHQWFLLHSCTLPHFWHVLVYQQKEGLHLAFVARSVRSRPLSTF